MIKQGRPGLTLEVCEPPSKLCRDSMAERAGKTEGWAPVPPRHLQQDMVEARAGDQTLAGPQCPWMRTCTRLGSAWSCSSVSCRPEKRTPKPKPKGSAERVTRPRPPKALSVVFAKNFHGGPQRAASLNQELGSRTFRKHGMWVSLTPF